ncbi:CPBP family intramembrane metalloprotease [Leucobacter triazinivorans]|uniref:CPBP family intramembrane metalloprotease n=1 Tax=Leucobacter triazinivorans TaxID=1784719 RepID=A0A4P6KJR1_9MICO|nr:CPBP family intramembrane metalloprotease [Leucobacter triazinivorans]
METEPLDYHRLLRGTPAYRWWKPLALLLLSGVFFGILTVLVTVAVIPVLTLTDPDYPMQVAAGTAEVLDTQRPISVLVSMVSIIIMLPAVLLAMLVMGMRPIGRIWSVAARMRWGLLGRLLGVSVLAIVVMNLVGIGVGLLFEPATDAAAATSDTGFDARAALLSMLLVLFLVPLQSTAEEVVFRGLFMQVLGAWIRSPWFAILIPSIGFASLHIYDIWGLLAVGLLGAVSAWLTWRTGGLEAAIAIHIVNNYVAFGIMASGLTGETAQTAGDGNPAGLIGQIAGLALFVWLTLRVFTRGGHGRQRIDLIQIPVAPREWGTR